MAYGARSGKQLSSLAEGNPGRFKWWHKIDVPTIQMLTADESVFAELSWPDGVRYHGSTAYGQCEDSAFDFKKSSSVGGEISILREGTEVGRIKIVTGRPSTITLSDGHVYTLRSEGFLREDWVLVDENGESLLKLKRIYPDVQVSGEVEMLTEGTTSPPMLLLTMAAWYAVQ